MHWEEKFGKHCLYCDLTVMGNDFTLSVYGGDAPHVGSVVMSTARPSLTGKGLGVTSSVLNGGIHIDNITEEQLAQVQIAAEKILKQLLDFV